MKDFSIWKRRNNNNNRQDNNKEILTSATDMHTSEACKGCKPESLANKKAKCKLTEPT